MLSTTLPRLRCPCCGGPLDLSHVEKSPRPAEIRSGWLTCRECRAPFLILGGVALLVEDTSGYLQTHAKGIAKVVDLQEVPPEFREDFQAALAELEPEHIEEDLESGRVNALYLMNHYLKAGPGPDSQPEWWKPLSGPASPLIDELVRAHWDNGPFAQIREWIAELAKPRRFKAAVELGCGVGGLQGVLKPYCDFYLGVDSSFASIALARHLTLGVPYPGALFVPEDLLAGGLAREIKLPAPEAAIACDGSCDFVVTDCENPAVAPGWDLTLSLNMIDMLNEPENLPRLQHELLDPGGIAIQSCPYIWHEGVARDLREKLPAELRGNSARAVEWLYRQAGLPIEKSVDHKPWLFFKHVRQLEIYSVHMFTARKLTS